MSKGKPTLTVEEAPIAQIAGAFSTLSEWEGNGDFDSDRRCDGDLDTSGSFLSPSSPESRDGEKSSKKSKMKKVGSSSKSKLKKKLKSLSKDKSGSSSSSEANSAFSDDELTVEPLPDDIDIFPPKQPLTPENTLIAFDLHHVLFRPNYSEMAKHVLSSPSKKDLLGLFCSPSFVLKFSSEVTSEVPEKLLKEMAEDDDRVARSLEPLTMDLCNAQQPDMPTFEVVAQLKEIGFKIYLLSNIGHGYFADLRSKMPDGLFKDFDGFYTSNPVDGYATKSTPIPFQKFLERFNPDRQYPYVVFADDTEANVNKARSQGYIGIHYKNSEQLSEALRGLGVKIEKRSKTKEGKKDISKPSNDSRTGDKEEQKEQMTGEMRVDMSWDERKQEDVLTEKLHEALEEDADTEPVVIVQEVVSIEEVHEIV